MQEWRRSDVVIFIGDSITAEEKYTRILVDFYALHFPERQILFHNVAVPGGSSHVAVQNFDALICAKKPTTATVMFGMNDMRLSLYEPKKPITEALLKAREEAFEAYKENLRALHDKLGTVSHTFFAPTPYDENPEMDAPLCRGYDAMLRRAAAHISASFENSLDLHAVLDSAGARKLVPTVIGPDRIHPENIGHGIIAHKILEAQGFENPRLPLWDESITEKEKEILALFGIHADTAPKNPFSDARYEASKRLVLYKYVELNVLAGQGIDTHNKGQAKKFIEMQLETIMDAWRENAYRTYLENCGEEEKLQDAVLVLNEKMYKVK